MVFRRLAHRKFRTSPLPLSRTKGRTESPISVRIPSKWSSSFVSHFLKCIEEEVNLHVKMSRHPPCLRMTQVGQVPPCRDHLYSTSKIFATLNRLLQLPSSPIEGHLSPSPVTVTLTCSTMSLAPASPGDTAQLRRSTASAFT